MFIFNFGSMVWVLAALLCGAAMFSILRRRVLRRPSLTVRHHRGRVRREVREVQQTLGRVDNGFQWGRCVLPARVAYGHLAVVGATGSGKTLLQRLLMQSVLPRIGVHPGQRALVYDAKQDILGLLAGMDLRCRIDLLNPLDSRSVAWDMAADIASPAAAWQAAIQSWPANRSSLGGSCGLVGSAFASEQSAIKSYTGLYRRPLCVESGSYERPYQRVDLERSLAMPLSFPFLS